MSESRPQIDVVCFTSHTGYGTAAKDLVLALHQAGWNLRITCLDHPLLAPLATSENRSLFRSLQQKVEELDRYHVFVSTPDQQRRVKKVYRAIGFATFETLGPPSEWVKVLNRNYAVICPSNFCKQVFLDAGVTRPIFVIPHVLNTDHFHMIEKPRDSVFRYLFFGNWKLRKGYEELLKAWVLEFKPDESVALHLRAEHSRDIDIAIRKVIGDRPHAPIIKECGLIKDEHLPSFLRSFDCLVSPSRGEGFGLPILQAMAVGTPVVATACTGVLDFLSEQTGWQVPVAGYEAVGCMDNIPQFRGRLWARIDPEILGKQMRAVLNDPVMASVKSRNAANLVKKHFSYSIASKRFDIVLGIIKS
jgi:glycosyltransferase involved in cell wall biosynthesis